MAPRALMGGVGGVLLAALGLLVGARMRASPEPPPALSAGAVRQRVSQPEAAEAGFLGVLIAEEAVDLSPRLEGRLESVRVQMGDRVRQGEVVATVETRALERELAVVEAELLSARAELRAAELAEEVAGERLRRREDPQQLRLGALSEEELATARYEQRLAEAKREGARARVREREARVAQLQQRLSEASLRAPFDGWVASRFVDPGALARVGQPVLHLLREGPRRVRFAVPGAQAPRVEVGQPVRVRGPEGGEVLTGRVTHVAPEVDVASGMVLAMARLEEAGPSRQLPAGTAVRVEVLAAQDGHPPMLARERDER